MTTARLLLAAALLGGPAAPLFAQGEANLVEPVKKPAKKKPVKKGYDYDRSKYKSRELAEGEIKTYRFNEKGDPVIPADKKKKSVPAKKRSEPPEEKPVERGCSEEKPCVNPDEADAL
jgi:hypothetical protein